MAAAKYLAISRTADEKEICDMDRPDHAAFKSSV